MDFLRPRTWPDAVTLRAQRPEALVVAGGTDVAVALNFDRIRPPALLDLSAVTELKSCETAGAVVRLGAGVTYHDVIARLAAAAPALATAARSVGSPQIRNRGTVGGNLGTASPAGDSHPPLLATHAEIQLTSVRGTRRVPVREFFVGPKRSVLAPDELIEAVHIPRAAGPQQFAKVGTRNAMVIAVCSLAVALDVEHERVGTGIGSAGPVPLVAVQAEQFLAGVLDEHRLWATRRALPSAAVDRFAELVAGAARPIDDVRGSAVYRRHALQVLAGRLLTRTWEELRGAEAA